MRKPSRPLPLRSLMVACVATTTLLAATPADAGGWWSYVDTRGPVGAGETLVVESETTFTTVEQAQQAKRTPYHAYLVRHYDQALLRRAMTRPDPSRWWALSPAAELVHVGSVRLDIRTGNLGMARARITIPEIAVGRWNLMFCDQGCRTPLGDLIPTPVRVTSDPVTARNARRVAVLEEHVLAITTRGRAERQQARLTAATTEDKFEIVSRQLAHVRSRLRALESAAPQPAPARRPWLIVAAALLLLIGGLLVVKRPRSTPDGSRGALTDVGADGVELESPRALVGAGVGPSSPA